MIFRHNSGLLQNEKQTTTCFRLEIPQIKVFQQPFFFNFPAIIFKCDMLQLQCQAFLGRYHRTMLDKKGAWDQYSNTSHFKMGELKNSLQKILFLELTKRKLYFITTIQQARTMFEEHYGCNVLEQPRVHLK